MSLCLLHFNVFFSSRHSFTSLSTLSFNVLLFSLSFVALSLSVSRFRSLYFLSLCSPPLLSYLLCIFFDITLFLFSSYFLLISPSFHSLFSRSLSLPIYTSAFTFSISPLILFLSTLSSPILHLPSLYLLSPSLFPFTHTHTLSFRLHFLPTHILSLRFPQSFSSSLFLTPLSVSIILLFLSTLILSIFVFSLSFPFLCSLSVFLVCLTPLSHSLFLSFFSPFFLISLFLLMFFSLHLPIFSSPSFSLSVYPFSSLQSPSLSLLSSFILSFSLHPYTYFSIFFFFFLLSTFSLHRLFSFSFSLFSYSRLHETWQILLDDIFNEHVIDTCR